MGFTLSGDLFSLSSLPSASAAWRSDDERGIRASFDWAHDEQPAAHRAPLAKVQRRRPLVACCCRFRRRCLALTSNIIVLLAAPLILGPSRHKKTHKLTGPTAGLFDTRACRSTSPELGAAPTSLVVAAQLMSLSSSIAQESRSTPLKSHSSLYFTSLQSAFASCFIISYLFSSETSEPRSLIRSSVALHLYLGLYSSPCGPLACIPHPATVRAVRMARIHHMLLLVEAAIAIRLARQDRSSWYAFGSTA